MLNKVWSVLVALLGLGSYAFADLQVYPTRVLLTEKTRSAQVSLRHRGANAMKYRISAVFYRMNPDGSMVLVEKPEAKDLSAIPYIKFSPKVVNLLPNVEQVVRILYTFPKESGPGEYRAHLYFEDMDETVPQTDVAKDSKVAAMTLKARMAIAIPVVVRSGEVSANVQLSNLKLVRIKDQAPAFSVQVEKTGNKNLYGDFRAFFRPQGGEEVLIGTVNGVSSYIDKREASFPLQVPDKLSLERGVLRLDFLESVSEGGKVLASTQVDIGKAN